MDIKKLQEAGLSSNEARVYFALLKIGSSSASELVKEAGIHRVLVYDVLDRLVEKGLIGTVTRTNKRYYQAADPSELLEYIDRQKRELDARRDELSTMVPELQGLMRLAEKKEEVQVYRGIRGIITALDKFFAQKKSVYVFGSSGSTRDYLGHHFSKYRRHIRDNKIFGKMIYYESRMGGDAGFPGWDVRFLPDKYKNPLIVDVSGKMVLIMLFSGDVIGILIENQQIADSYMQYFNIMWEMAKP